MVARILEERGSTVGLACTDGVYLGRTQVNTGVYSGVSGALQVLLDSRAQVGVLEVSRGTLIERGLGYDWATAGACTKVQAEHLGLNGVETVDDMARVKGLVVERASEVAVVNAQDPRCMQMLSRTRALRHILVSADPCASALQDPLSAGTMAVVLEGPEDAAEIRIWEQSGKHSLLRIDEIPAAWGGAAAHNVENAKFAVAISAGMGIPVEPIRRALRGFQSSPDDSPNRLNIYTKLPFTVVLDRAGTTPGYEALCDFVDRLAPAGRKILGFFGTGDRRDQDLRATAARVAASFDRFVCFDGANLRGRRPMEVPNLMKSVLLANGVADEDVILCPGKQDAVQRILADAKSRDFVVIASGSGFQEVLGWLEEASSAASSAAT
jgi:cyanophycin synthetase